MFVSICHKEKAIREQTVEKVAGFPCQPLLSFNTVKLAQASTSSHFQFKPHYIDHGTMSSYNLSMPAMAAPEGVSPNFEHPEDQNELAWITLTLMMVVSTLCVILRVYGRVYLPKKIVIEDGMYRRTNEDNSQVQPQTSTACLNTGVLILTSAFCILWQSLSCALT